MPTDTERREVALRLRDYVGLPDDWWQETRAEFYVEKCVFGDVNRHREGELFARLADLIEPSCDRDTPQKAAEEMFGKMRHSTREEADAYEAMLKSKSVEIHPVDRDALLALADGLEYRANELIKAAQHARFSGLGPTMERAKHDTYEMRIIASRIREALGVES